MSSYFNCRTLEIGNFLNKYSLILLVLFFTEILLFINHCPEFPVVIMRLPSFKKPMWCCLHHDLLIANCIKEDVISSAVYICELTALQMLAACGADLESMNRDGEVFLF